MLCFRKIPFEKKLVDKMGGGWGGRECHGFLSKLFILSAPKKCVAEPFVVSLKLFGEDFYVYEDYVTIFCRFFPSRGTRKLRRGTLLCLKKVLVSKFFCRSFMYRSTERLRWGTLLSFKNFLVSESNMNKMGGLR